jgi:prepilin-type N-terminal cleavage/methylation domain-containing protein
MKKGFTLIELLAVIVILALVLAIAIPSISNIAKSSSKSAFESNIKMVLKTIDYKKTYDSLFDPSAVDESTINNLLSLDNSNYKTVTVKKMGNTIHVTVIGQNKWNGLTGAGTISVVNVGDTVTNFVRGANVPVLTTGMTPIKWDGSTWVDTTESDADWYNYNTTDKKWANARTADGSMWVWIPRYIYKISSNWHVNTTGTIDVQFSKGLDDNWNKAVIGNISVAESANASNGTWTNHPAFTFGDIELTGIWVSKFEASAAEDLANGYTFDGSCPVVGDNVTTKTIKSVPNATSWRCISVGNMFTSTRNMETNEVYGWGTTGKGIDIHLMKNTEWGVIAYLSKSNYGQGSNEIWINNSQTYTTGCAGASASAEAYNGCQNTYDTTNGQQASTTGNIYGVYDMSGGSFQAVAAYVNNANSNLEQGSSITESIGQYKDVYAVGKNDDEALNYGLAINQKGDAIYETSNNIADPYSWFNDYSSMPYTSYSWFLRSGKYDFMSIAGAFLFGYSNGGSSSFIGFRPVLVVNAGL